MQLGALIFCACISRFERWQFFRDYPVFGNLSQPIISICALVLAWSIFIFPIAVTGTWLLETPRERLAWVAPLLSLAMSFAQLLAILSAVQ
jgi:hypothetical protein